MKRKDTTKLIAIFILLLIILSVNFVFLSIKNSHTSETIEAYVYYYDPIPKELIPVKTKLSSSLEVAVREIFEDLKEPKEITYFPTLPKELTLDYVKFNNNTLTLNILTNGVKKSEREEYIAFLSLANSLKSIKGVNNLKFLINSQESETFLRYVNIQDTLNNLTSTLPKFKEVNLFFLTNDLKYIAVEKREVLLKQSPVEFAKKILDELAYGSNIGLVSFLKIGDIKSIEIKSGGIAVVNFSDRINEISLGSSEANLFVESIVNSLTEISDIQSVSFEIEGIKVDTLFGAVDTTFPLRRFNEGANLKFIIPYYVSFVNGNPIYIPYPIVTKNITLEGVINALKTPQDSNLKTFLKDINFVDMKLNNSTLKITLKTPKTLSSEEIDFIKNQILLTFTEITSINSIDLSIGEEAFILKR